jgi:hypothetical protein
MSEPNVLVSFRLERETPLRVKWLASDGVPGDGYKAQITAVILPTGQRLAMHGSSILEQTHPDPGGGAHAYLMTFTGVVGYAHDHADRPHVEALADSEIDYELEFVAEDGRIAVAEQDYHITERPPGMARVLSKKTDA